MKQILLFPYGTLQYGKVQLEVFGRILIGRPDVLKGFKIEQLKITDKAVLAKSRQVYHPIAVSTGNPDDRVEGTLFEISALELVHADSYEVSDDKRTEETFESGRGGWIYVKP